MAMMFHTPSDPFHLDEHADIELKTSASPPTTVASRQIGAPKLRARSERAARSRIELDTRGPRGGILIRDPVTVQAMHRNGKQLSKCPGSLSECISRVVRVGGRLENPDLPKPRRRLGTMNRPAMICRWGQLLAGADQTLAALRALLNFERTHPSEVCAAWMLHLPPCKCQACPTEDVRPAKRLSGFGACILSQDP
ncbi:hypothetical protein T4A_14464 [Trichinella pseudospiralis]|uniref:Uncharacterized protein n=1 Tax=Trichinella pseudospiralis TaxID=6337 RepID=A0A0V1DU09_TRIPS|nr:hypothetical protein T4A_14464 [Trichinella pseudospiralis]KRZ24606.1 hypothetical protein T4C_4981 [Trichinella pseudospiralis]